MAVYVDDMATPYRGMLMCHMLADTLQELHVMAGRIGIRRQWFQAHGSWPHYDICQAKRKLAVAMGAREITSREMVHLIRGWRTGTK